MVCLKRKVNCLKYNMKRGKSGINALDANDEIASVLFTNEEKIGISTEEGNFLICETKMFVLLVELPRVLKGIKAK